MLKREKLSAMRKQDFNLQEFIGAVNEAELKKVAGAGDVNPETTPLTVATPFTPEIATTVAAASISLCPTTKCTSKC